VAADKARIVDAGSGCSLAESWHAERSDVAADAPAIEIVFEAAEQDSASSISCPGAVEPSGAVGGVIGTPAITLPPTDATVRTGAASTSDPGAAVVVGLIFGMAGLSLVLRRPRRGDG
jgi:hypothetical protein